MQLGHHRARQLPETTEGSSMQQLAALLTSKGGRCWQQFQSSFNCVSCMCAHLAVHHSSPSLTLPGNDEHAAAHTTVEPFWQIHTVYSQMDLHCPLDRLSEPFQVGPGCQSMHVLTTTSKLMNAPPALAPCSARPSALHTPSWRPSPASHSPQHICHQQRLSSRVSAPHPEV